jgi:hypothetical protein
MRLEYDHHFELASGARFHADHADPCIRVVQITTGKSSEILCTSLVGSRDPVNKGVRKGVLNRARCIILRSVAKRIHLWRDVLDIHLRNIIWYSLERWVVLELGYLGRVLHRGIHMRGSIFRVSLIKRKLGSR